MFIKKKPGSTEPRLVIDYKQTINEGILRPQHYQPSAEQLAEEFKPGLKVWAAMDIKSAYWLLPLAEGPNGSELTTFSTHLGNYCWRVMPMGVKPAGDYLAGTMVEVLAPVKEKVKRLVDDLATGAANDEEMYNTLKLLFSQCREFGVALNAEKFCYGHRINFGGCILSEDGVTADPNRLQAIAEFETPDSREKVRRFLGICQTLSQYTACLQQSTINMKRLLRKEERVQRGEEGDE